MTALKMHPLFAEIIGSLSARPTLVEQARAAAENAPALVTALETLDVSAITDDMGPADVIHAVKESATPACFQRITPESVLVEIETDPLTFATRFVRLAESLTETQRCVRDMLGHLDRIANFTNGLPRREEFDELRLEVGNIAQGGV